MHALVLMVPDEPAWRADELQEAHEEFIGRLEQDHRVVLGGELTPPAGGYAGGYVLRCGSLDEAREVAASDPLAQAGAIRCEVVEWVLVGVDADAVDRDALLFP